MDIDPDRWQALLDQLANAADAGPSFGLLQGAQQRWSRARVALDDFRARGPLGKRDLRNADLVAMFERDAAELEKQFADADRDVKRIEALQQESIAKRAGLEELVTGIRDWAQAQDPPVNLPGAHETSMGGFAATIHIQTPPGRQPFDMSGRHL